MKALNDDYAGRQVMIEELKNFWKDFDSMSNIDQELFIKALILRVAQGDYHKDYIKQVSNGMIKRYVGHTQNRRILSNYIWLTREDNMWNDYVKAVIQGTDIPEYTKD